MPFGTLKLDTLESSTRTVSVDSLQTQAQVQATIDALVNGAPGALNTLQELAAALGNDANFAGTVTNALANRLQLSGGTMTGAITLAGNPSANLHAAPKQYVDTQIQQAAPKGFSYFCGGF